MSRRPLFLGGIAALSAVLWLVFFGSSLFPLLREPLSAGRDLLLFDATSPAPVSVVGKQVYRGLNGPIYAMEGSQTGAGFPFTVGGPGIVTVMVSARTSERGAMTLALEGPSGTTAVATKFGMRHRAFDLTPLLSGSGPYTLWFRPAAGNGVAVREVVIRQSPHARRPPVNGLLMVFAIFVLGRVWRAGRVDGASATALIFLVALAARWVALSSWVAQPLQGDAVTYAEIARDFSLIHPFQTGMREPVQVWLYRALALLGGGPFAARALSAVFSAATAALLVPLGERLFGRMEAGVAAGLLSAAGDFYNWNGVRGERAEVYVLLMVAFLLTSLRMKRDGPLWKDAALGVLGGALGLTWLIGPIGAALTYAVRLKDADRRWVRAAVFAATLALVVLPHLIAQKKVNGDPFFALNAHTNFYRNAEETGVPSYAGGKRAMASWFLGSPVKRAKELVSGYALIFVDPTAPFNRIFLGFHYDDWRSLLLYPFLLAGLIAAVWTRRGLAFWFALAFVNVSPAMTGAVRDPRLFLHASVFIALFFGYGVAVAAGAGGRLARLVKR